MKRIFSIDFIRGLAIVPMILYNYSVTLAYFGLINILPSFLYSFVFPRLVAAVFIFVSGIAAYVTFRSHKEDFAKLYFGRGMKLLFFAILISIFTYVFVPRGTILFGILHFFAFSSFLAPFFIKYNKLNLIMGLFLTLVGIYLQMTSFNFSYLFWLGFVPANFSTFDYFPLVPWIGVLMLGIYFGKSFVKKTSKFNSTSILGRLFVFLGRNSLTIYLVHQPLLIFALIAIGFKLFF